jgi:hypothetical protein
MGICIENKALVKQNPKIGMTDPWMAPIKIPIITFIVGFE